MIQRHLVIGLVWFAGRTGFKRVRRGVQRHLVIGLASFALVFSQAIPGLAALEPGQIAVLAMRDSRESQAVAAYYARIREIPRENICLIDAPKGEILDRAAWQTNVRPAIREWLRQRNLDERIRCFVTVWDVPLKIGKAEQDPHLVELSQFLARERQTRIEQLNELIRQLGQLNPDPNAAPVEALPADASFEAIKTALQQAFTGAQQRVSPLSAGEEKNRLLGEIRRIFVTSYGLIAVTQALGQQVNTAANVNPNLKTEFDFVRGRTMGLRDGISTMEVIPHSIERDVQMLAVVQISEGLAGTLSWIDRHVDELDKNETYSSFDSELSLVLWPDDYSLLRWQPNYLNYRFDRSAARHLRKTLMVSRIEAPTLALTRQLIDTAMQVEQQGLNGKAYFDGRGVAQTDQPVEAGSYPDFDNSVVQTADLLKKHTKMEVVLDTGQELFQPGACPDAAIYCGWYSLAKYVDAFDWKPGAVGYHLASSEATTIRSPESQVWCKRMLDDGVCATLGPVYEPYLMSFPKPSEFFTLLLSGRYTLAECYYRTAPYTSWNMVLIGDPLYTPFKNNPQFDLSSLPEPVRAFIEAPGTPSGSSTGATSPSS